MEHVSTQRRLVKSPPELWAELSDAEALARLLGELGEIRITRTLPESVVAWEAERASGVIEIGASGWGTKVSLAATPAAAPAPPPPPAALAPAKVRRRVRVVGERTVRIEIPVPAPEPPAPPPPEPAPRGLFARLFRRERPAAAEPPPPPPPPPPAEVLELRIVHAVCATVVPERPPPPEPAPTPAAVEPQALRGVLERVLDDLGAAHHRPFSRA